MEPAAPNRTSAERANVDNSTPHGQPTVVTECSHTESAEHATEQPATHDKWHNHLRPYRSNTDATELSPNNVAPIAHNANTEMEFALVTIIPFLANHTLGYTMCDHKPGHTRSVIINVTRRGEHFHTWCEPCAREPHGFRHCFPEHGTCLECTALRTLSLLSVQWHKFCWDGLPTYDLWT